MLTSDDKKRLKELQHSFRKMERTNNIEEDSVNKIIQEMNDILFNASLFERLCTKEIIYDHNEKKYRLLTKPVNLAYARQDQTFIKNKDFQNKMSFVMQEREKGYRFLDCFRINGKFIDEKFICTRIRLCDRFDTKGNEYFQIDFYKDNSMEGKIEKKKKGTIFHEGVQL